jgi:hypothetical protein
MNRPPKSKAIERLQKVLDEIPELKQLQLEAETYSGIKKRRLRDRRESGILNMNHISS